MAEQNTDRKKSERLLISRVQPGMVLAADVYTRGNQVVLNAGSVLDAQKISKIMFYSVDTVSVYVPEEEKSGGQDLEIKNSVEFREFSLKYDDAVNSVKNSMDLLAAGNDPIDEDSLMDSIDAIIAGSSGKTGIFNMLHCIRDYDELTFSHSVNVSLICNCFGQWLGLGEEEQRLLTLAGLLHDVGKLSIPKEILLKPDALTEEEYAIMQQHTVRGYELLGDRGIDERIREVALNHHERADGSGYPYHKTGDDIDDLSMIVAIADVYDAMTSDRTYRPRFCPFEVIKTMSDEAGSRYRAKFLVPLLSQISQVYMNHTVRLSDGTSGRIVMMNSELHKPVVQVDDIFVDLSKNRNLTITEVI